MKFGVAVSTFPTTFAPIPLAGDLAHSLPRLKDMGYQGIDLYIRRADEPGLDGVVRLIQGSGLQVAIVAAVAAFVEEGLFLSSPVPEVRRKMLERMQAQVRFAASLGAMVSIGVLRGKEGGEDRLKLLADSLFELSRIAEPLGVPLVLEPVNRYETSLINTLRDALDFLERYGLPPFGLLADVFHMNIEEPSIEGGLRQAGPRLAHVHFADSNRRAPGLGHIDWPAIFAALQGVGYRGFCSLECIPGPDPMGELDNSLKFLEALRSAYR